MSTLVDTAARERIITETSAGLFVEAGAGSGKTRSLVERIVTLVMVDGARLAEVAAVTFTEKAGAELRDRLRAEFERRWQRARDTGGEGSEGSARPDEETRAAQALDDLDSAAIGTLHSFAQRILTMHPIEAGLPPLVEVMDEVASSVAFEQRWTELRAELLEEESLSETLVLAMAAGVKLDHLRSLAKALGNDWDLIESHVLAADPPGYAFPDVTGLVTRAAELAARAEECTNPEDLFLDRLAALGQWGVQLGEARDERAQLAMLLAAADLKFNHGRGNAWGGRLVELRGSCKDLQEQAKALVGEVVESLLRPLTHWLAVRVERAAHERAADGRLEYHDLLVLARSERPDFLQPEAVDLDLLTSDLFAKSRSLADRDWKLAGTGLGIIEADPQRLTQAVMNLADNAVRHTEPGDTIELGSTLGDGEARLWVRDSGPGIPADQQDQIFERFARTADGERRPGTAGLGLAIVRGIARAHGGRATVDSTPGAGATFTVAIPADCPEDFDDDDDARLDDERPDHDDGSPGRHRPAGQEGTP